MRTISGFQRQSLRDQLARAAVEFQRDFYLRTEEEMRAKWIEDPAGAKVLPYLGVEPIYLQAIENGFEDHLPFWEFTRAFGFHGKEQDPVSQKMVECAEFRLEPSLHREQFCRRIQRHMLSGTKDRVGLALFIGRYMLKTGIGCVSLALWLLTRHRVLFDDYTTIRIIHDVKEKAIDRSLEIKKKLMNCQPLRALYPEVALPPKWGTSQFWDLPGREESSRYGLDFQIAALGVKSAKQGMHPMYTIIDDVESERHAESTAAVEETKNYFRGFQYSEQLGLSRNILLGTFYNPASVHATIFENWELAEKGELDPRSTWEVIHIPAARNYGSEETRELAYPLRLDYPTLEQMRLRDIAEFGNDLTWNMQMLLDFRSSNVYMFDMERWQEIDLQKPSTEAAHRVLEAVWKSPIFIQADLAGKDESTRARGDWNAIWVVGYPVIDGQIHRVLLDLHHDDVSDIAESARIALGLARAYDAWYIVAEEAVAHRFVGKTFTDEAAAAGLRYFQAISPSGKQTGNIVTLVPKAGAARAVGSLSSWKMARINKFQGAWNANRVWVNSAIPEEILHPFRTQVGSFPFIKRDDLIDAVALCDDERVAYLIPQPRVHMAERRRPVGKRSDFVTMGRYTGLTLPKGG